MNNRGDKRPAIFLDRDGTLNVEKQYLHKIEDWEWIPGAIDAIKLINDMGYLAIVVTNQAGIARGYYDQQALKELHSHVDALLAKENAHIDAYYYCPHHPNFGKKLKCKCRKPYPGMLMAAQQDYDIDFNNSYIIGDKASDVQTAKLIDIIPILVLTGYGVKEKEKCSNEITIKNNVLDAVYYIFGA